MWRSPTACQKWADSDPPSPSFLQYTQQHHMGSIQQLEPGTKKIVYPLNECKWGSGPTHTIMWDGTWQRLRLHCWLLVGMVWKMRWVVCWGTARRRGGVHRWQCDGWLADPRWMAFSLAQRCLLADRGKSNQCPWCDLRFRKTVCLRGIRSRRRIQQCGSALEDSARHVWLLELLRYAVGIRRCCWSQIRCGNCLLYGVSDCGAPAVSGNPTNTF